MTWIRCIAKHEGGNDLRRCPPFKSGSELQLPSALGWLSHESPEQSVYEKLALVIRVKRNEEFFSVRAAHNTQSLIWTSLVSWSLGKWCLECREDGWELLSTHHGVNRGTGCGSSRVTEPWGAFSPPPPGSHSVKAWPTMRASSNRTSSVIAPIVSSSVGVLSVKFSMRRSPSTSQLRPFVRVGPAADRARRHSAEIFYPSVSRQSGHIKYILPPHTSEPAALGKKNPPSPMKLWVQSRRSRAINNKEKDAFRNKVPNENN